MDPVNSLQNELVILPPNRVWRTYPGGATLDQLAGKPTPLDSHFAEDWIGSVTRAVNPGREEISEGISPVQVGSKTIDFAELLATDPEYFLGSTHLSRHARRPCCWSSFWIRPSAFIFSVIRRPSLRAGC